MMTFVRLERSEIERCIEGAMRKALEADTEGDKELADRYLEMAAKAERDLCLGRFGITYF